MKKILFLILFYLLANNSFSQAFVTTWNCSKNLSTTIIIPGYGTNYNIVWEQIGKPTHNGSLTGTNTTTINFGDTGIYRVSINGGSPAFYRINFGNIPINESAKLITVENWGNIQWSTMKDAFKGCYYFTSLPITAPDLSLVTDFSRMFYNCTNFNSNISNWNLSNAMDLSSMFYNAWTFDQPLNNWNVSNVENTSYMFWSSQSFNQSLNSWNTNNIKDMRYMFNEAYAFNQPLNNWNVGKVKNMTAMFYNAYTFNQPLNNWNIKSCDTLRSMFSYALAFNQDLDNWKMDSAKDIVGMFYNAENFNGKVETWDISKINSLESVFAGAKSFNQPLNNWNTSSVVNMGGTFWDAESFNQPLNNWNTNKVQIFGGTFSGAKSFNQPINIWDISNAYSLQAMFASAANFNRPLNNWNTSNVQSLAFIFDKAYSFNQNISSWNVSNVKNQGSSYPISFDSSGLDIVNYDSLLIGWGSQKVDSNIIFTAKGLQYCQGKNYRDTLKLSQKWLFDGDTISSTCVLPILLKTFTATPQQNKVLLQWQTATETNNNYFTVQRSINSKDWENIATVNGSGNSSTFKTYQAIDSKPINGVNYYRIEQTDFNGSVSYSQVKNVAFKVKSNVDIYPNPASNMLHINLDNKATLKMYNIIGKLVLNHNLLQGDNVFSIVHLPTGIYIANIVSNNVVTTLKVIKQ